MKINNPGGKIYFFKSDKSQNPKDCFTPLLEVNANFDNLKSLHLGNGKAYGITVNNELLEWEFEKKQKAKKLPQQTPAENSDTSSTIPTSKNQNKKNDYYFLISKPSYRFHKIKIKSIRINKTMCLSLDINGNVLVWGQNKEGLLGLGYEVTSVETPTMLEGLVDITDISLSDYHAVALNSSGNPFSWGLGKYGELGLERSIYSPVPQQMNTEGLYFRVFCGNLITCFLDFDGHFSYFGVIIRQLGGNSSTITVKNLLNDQNIDAKSIFLEKEIEELEDQKFKDIIIGNGFISLLSNTGTLFTLEYNDKLTMLYSKYYLYNIVVAKNEIFGLAKDSIKISESQNNISNNNLINNSSINNNNVNDEEKIKTNYYLCRWSSKSSSENEVCSDVWNTTIWKFKDEFTSTIENCKLLDSNENRNILLLLDSDEKFITNLNTSVLNPNKRFLDSSNNEMSLLDSSLNNNNTTFLDNLIINLNKKKLPTTILEYEAEFDDSFNLKYKRTRAKGKRLAKDTSYMASIRSRSLSPYLNKSYNASFQNSALNLNKSNIGHIGNNNISAIGLNSSGFMSKKNSQLIPNNNNHKKNNSKGFGNNNLNYPNKNNSNNFLYSKSSFSVNNNDLSKDNNDIDNNNLSNIHNISGNNINNFNSSMNKSNTLKKEKEEKDGDNINIEESIDVKERELNKYRSEIDDIIANYKNRRVVERTNLMNKYGITKDNNANVNKTGLNNYNNIINLNDGLKKNSTGEIYNEQNLSRDNIINNNINNDKLNNNDNNSTNKKKLFLKKDSYSEANFENIMSINTNNNNSMKNDYNNNINDEMINNSNKNETIKINENTNRKDSNNNIQNNNNNMSLKNYVDKNNLEQSNKNKITSDKKSPNMIKEYNNLNKNNKNEFLKKKINEINQEIMNGLKNYFQANKNLNSNENYRRRKNNRKIRKENEIKFNMNRQETFQDIYNMNNNNENKDDYNSLIITSSYSLFLPNTNFIHKKSLSEGNNSFIYDNNYNRINNNHNLNHGCNNAELYSNKKNDMQFDNNKNNIYQNYQNYQNKNKYGNNSNYNNEIISSPAFNKGEMQKSRIAELIKNKMNNNNNNINEEELNSNYNFKNTKNNNYKNNDNNEFKIINEDTNYNDGENDNKQRNKTNNYNIKKNID